MQLRLPLFAFLLCSALVSVAEADPWHDGPDSSINFVDGALISRAGYVVDPPPQLNQVVWLHGVVINRTGGDALLNLEIRLPRGAKLVEPDTRHPENDRVCLLHNSKTGPSTLPCIAPYPTNTGFLFTRDTYLPKETVAGGFNSLEIRVPVVFDQPFNGPFTIATLLGPRWSEASVNMTVPGMTMGMMMVPGMPFMNMQPTPSPTALGDDLMLVGSSLADAGTLPVAFSNDDGSFTVTNYPVGDFAAWSRQPNVTRLAGDFDNDGNTDFALVGGSGWGTIPVAMAQGNGSFNVTNSAVTNFGAWADSTSVKPVAGDFDGDGNTDIALVGGTGWATVPIAFSNGDGTFNISNGSAGAFSTWAQATGARPIVGDFDGDTRSDIALVGGNGWTMLPHAYSNGDGTFTAYNAASYGSGYRTFTICGIRDCVGGPSLNYSWNFAQTVNEAGAQVVAADFDNDGMTDIAVTGTNTAQGPRIAFSNGDGTWQLVEHHDTTWATWANTAGAKVLVGDFNGDGSSDLALTGASGWNQLPMALGLGNRTFSITSRGIGNFGSWAAMPGARVAVGDFNGDGSSDLAVTGISGWTQIPVAMNTGNGFNILQQLTNRFPAWTPDTSASLFVGPAN